MRALSLLYLSPLIAPTLAYTLVDDYLANGQFFDRFNFFNSSDPTHGSVSYLSRESSEKAGLVSCSANNVKIRVDSSNVALNGRPSVRIESKQTYTQGLIILDLDHMPGGICGTWPAFWTLGPKWPTHGEIGMCSHPLSRDDESSPPPDIIEGVNSQTTNLMTLHTNAGCTTRNNTALATSQLQTPNCDIKATDQSPNAGCSFKAPNQNTYGKGFNRAGGGVYATEWTSTAISIWFFPRGRIPLDIAAGIPDPATWGRPLSYFKGDCNFEEHFKDHQIIFDTTFCGDWAEPDWNAGECKRVHRCSCKDYVAKNPAAFVEAYWSVNELKVYQQQQQGKKGVLDGGG